MKRFIENIQTPGTISDRRYSDRPSASRSTKKFVEVCRSPGTSIRHYGQRLNISRNSLQDWSLQTTQNENSSLNGLWNKNKWKLIFRKKHFTIDSFVNRQNCRTWGSANSRVISERPMHPQRVNNGSIIGPFFFEHAASQA